MTSVCRFKAFFIFSCFSFLLMNFFQSVSADDQAGPCLPPPVESATGPGCSAMEQDLITEQIKRDSLTIFNATFNKESHLMSAPKESIQESLSHLKSCNPEKQCSDISISTEIDLGRGWTQTLIAEAYSLYGGGCSFGGLEIDVSYNGVNVIKGAVSRVKDVLLYKLPSVDECDTEDIDIDRSVTTSENGVGVVDGGLADQSPGYLFILEKLRTPTLHPLEDGKIKVQLAEGTFFIVDGESQRIVDSNLLNAEEMFSPDKCRSDVSYRNGRSRSTPIITYAPGGRARVRRRMLQFGTRREERKLAEIVSKMRREQVDR